MKEKNEKRFRFKNKHRFREFDLQHDSAESMESWIYQFSENLCHKRKSNLRENQNYSQFPPSQPGFLSIISTDKKIVQLTQFE